MGGVLIAENVNYSIVRFNYSIRADNRFSARARNNVDNNLIRCLAQLVTTVQLTADIVV